MVTKPLRCLYAASEVAGFAKTGGLADVAGSLPRALAERGIECAVILPMYRSARESGQPMERTGHTVEVPLGSAKITYSPAVASVNARFGVSISTALPGSSRRR